MPEILIALQKIGTESGSGQSTSFIDNILYPEEERMIFVGFNSEVYHYKLHFFQSHGYEQISESLAKRAGHRLCHTCLRNREKWMNE